MKRLLILAYDFPPYVSVGGLRPYNWLKYLKEYEIEPVVVTRQWCNTYGNGMDYIVSSEKDVTIIESNEWGTVLRTPYKATWSNRLLLKYGEQKYRLFRKVLTALNEVRQYIWISGSKKQLYKEARAYLKEHKVDAIIATGDPFVLFFYAKKLSQEFSIPWIADYRDPWSRQKNIEINRFYFYWNRFLEKKIVKTSSAICTVSDFFKMKVSSIVPNDISIHIIRNGYDPEVIDLNSVSPQESDCLTISFIGTIYQWHPWKSFVEQVSEYMIANPGVEIRLNFYGINIPEEVQQVINQLPERFQDLMKVYSRIPNSELMQQIAKENVMLLFNYYSFEGTKIYDYLGMKRKIILCYSNDEKAMELKRNYYSYNDSQFKFPYPQIEIIKETNSGVIVENEKHLQQVLLDLITEFNETGKIACDSIGVENYSRKIQVQKLAEIIKKLP